MYKYRLRRIIGHYFFFWFFSIKFRQRTASVGFHRQSPHRNPDCVPEFDQISTSLSLLCSATCKSPKNEGTQLRSQRQNDSIIVIARHEAPGAISSEEFFAGGSVDFDLPCLGDFPRSRNELGTGKAKKPLKRLCGESLRTLCGFQCRLQVFQGCTG